MFLFTDGFKDPETELAGAAVYIPMSDCFIKKRVTNHLSVYICNRIIGTITGPAVDRGEENKKHCHWIR